MSSGSHIQLQPIVAMLSDPKMPTPNPPGQGQSLTTERKMPQRNWRVQFRSRRTGYGPDSRYSITTAPDSNIDSSLILQTPPTTVFSTSEAPPPCPVTESGKGLKDSPPDRGDANDDDSPEFDTESESLYRFRDSLFVARSQFIEIPTKHSATWQTNIRPRLRKDLMTTMERIHAKSRSKAAKESAVFLDLRMSGSTEKKASRVKLSIAIWILCGSKWCKKLISSCIHNLDWLPYPGFGMEIHLGGPLPSASSGNNIERILSFDAASFIPLTDGGKLWVHLEKPTPNNPCNGLLCSCIVEADGKREQGISKIGGILTIKKTQDHELRYALTTAHGLFERLPQRSQITDESDSELESDSDRSQDGSDSGSMSTCQSDSVSPEVTNHLISEARIPEQVEWMNVSDNFRAYFSQERIGRDLEPSPLPVPLERSQQAGSDPDFAVAGPCCREGFQNDLNPDHSQTVTVQGIKQGTLSSPATRVLLRPDESIVAHIVPEEATYYLNGRERSVYKLELPSFLASGNSGSWVVRDGAFAGMVIANSGTEPIALMLPEKQLKLSIAESLGLSPADISAAQDVAAAAKQSPTTAPNLNYIEEMARLSLCRVTNFDNESHPSIEVDGPFWDRICSELTENGFSKAVIENHQGILKAQVKQLLKSKQGVLDAKSDEDDQSIIRLSTTQDTHAADAKEWESLQSIMTLLPSTSVVPQDRVPVYSQRHHSPGLVEPNTLKMAEAIGVVSGLVALTTFAFKSSAALYQTIGGFRHCPKTVRDLHNELEALQKALQSLTETADSIAEADLSVLKLPLLRCGNACRDFEQIILNLALRPDKPRENFRDWAKLRYLGDDIDNFRQTLAGYKFTILIVITDVTIRTIAITAEKLDNHREMIKVATANLEGRLEIIDAKLESIFQQIVPGSDKDAAELRQIKEDQLSTQKCLRICLQLSHHIDQIQVPPLVGHALRDARLIDPEAVTLQAVQECRAKLSITAARLEKNMQDSIKRLVSMSKTANNEETAELVKLQTDWEAARKCIRICSMADTNLSNNINIIDNFTAGEDAAQFLISTDKKIIHAKNRGYHRQPTQLGGHLSEELHQQMSITALSRPKGEHGATAPNQSLQLRLDDPQAWNGPVKSVP